MSRNYQGQNFIMLPVPESMFGAVCALLGGASSGAIAASAPAPASRPAPSSEPASDNAPEANQPAGGAPATDSGEVDTGGHPWSETLHASTKTKTKDGYWRMKVGVSRPADLPGFPKEAGASAGATGTQSNGADSQAGASVSGANAGPATEEEDEFAAFRAAADKAGATDAAAAASVPARKWSDADLGALCNQAAVKLGDPKPVKDVIADFVPEGQVSHSRNIPEDKREAFAQAVEKAAGITFGG